MISKTLRKVSFEFLQRLTTHPIREHLLDIDRYFHDPRHYETIRQERLERFIRHATQTTRYYRHFSGVTDITRFPILNKETIKDRFTDFISSKYSTNKLFKVKTSGSYGTPMTFFLTAKKRQRQLAEIIYFSRWAGYEIGLKHVHISTRKKSFLTQYLLNEIVCDPTYMDEQWFVKQRLVLVRKDIQVVIGYSTALLLLAEFCKTHGDTPENFRFKSIITIGEPIYPSGIKLLESVFGCKVYRRYASLETGVLAHDREPSGPFMFNQSTYLIEILSLHDDTPVKPGQSGRVVVTDLFSFAMPLIRYDIGDIAILCDNEAGEPDYLCARSIEGRISEIIYRADGSPVSSIAVDDILDEMTFITRYQFIQEGASSYRLLLMTKSDNVDEALIQKRLQELLGTNARIYIEYVDTFVQLLSGKCPVVMNNYLRENKRFNE